jgi:hypothetical protein
MCQREAVAVERQAFRREAERSSIEVALGRTDIGDSSQVALRSIRHRL